MRVGSEAAPSRGAISRRPNVVSSTAAPVQVTRGHCDSAVFGRTRRARGAVESALRNLGEGSAQTGLLRKRNQLRSDALGLDVIDRK